MTANRAKSGVRGPYTTAAAEEQRKYLKAQTDLAMAEADLKKLENKKPELTDAKSVGAVTQKLGVYLILWLYIFLSYAYQPREKPVELSQRQ